MALLLDPGQPQLHAPQRNEMMEAGMKGQADGKNIWEV